jgi:DNA repair exonuclease SbcCD ATPase subunit
MGNLRVNQVKYTGNRYVFESEIFDKNIVLIEGDNGTGKSTLCDLIYFALGGEVRMFRRNIGGKINDQRHEQITSDTENYVDLDVSIGDKNYILRRYIADNDITVIPYKTIVVKDENTIDGKEELVKIISEFISEKTLVLPVNRSERNNFIFSDWILDKLGISVVELFHGWNVFKINFSDLMRLIYHDQQPDPENIIKRPDTKSTLVSDSEAVRNAIFELLIGKSYSDYYDAIVEEKQLAKERVLAKSLVDEYTLLADKMRKDGEVRNVSFLQKEILDKELRIEQLHNARQAFKMNRHSFDSVNQDIESLKANIIDTEISLGDHKDKLLSFLNERGKLARIRTETATEIRQIEKVIFSHDQLNLFTADTCPYCLTKVTRQDNHCVCGSKIEEEQYERFFYTSQEYKDILKSKVKTLATIQSALDDCNNDVDKVKEDINTFVDKLSYLRTKLGETLQRVDQPIDVERLNDIDDKILELREDVSSLHQLLEIESKLEGFQKSYDEKREKAKAAELNRKVLEAQAKQDVASKVADFSRKYNELMVDTLPDCRSARIRLEDYLPLINDGLYQEKSALVSRRLMYYITMMHLALADDKVTFPRFLLIDTPETAGIELDHLKNCISKLSELEGYGKRFQVIISTGLGKYPDAFKSNRVLYMPDKTPEHMLLQRQV